MLETVNDTKRAQGFPKRITVFMFSKKTSLEFERVKSINNTVYVSEMLKKLEVPPACQYAGSRSKRSCQS